MKGNDLFDVIKDYVSASLYRTKRGYSVLMNSKFTEPELLPIIRMMRRGKGSDSKQVQEQSYAAARLMCHALVDNYK